jgi:hypothetical protein
LGYTISTPSCLDRSWVVKNISNGRGGDAQKRQRYTSMDEFPDAVWDFLVRDYIARKFIGFLEYYSMAVKRDNFCGRICGYRGIRFSAAKSQFGYSAWAKFLACQDTLGFCRSSR